MYMSAGSPCLTEEEAEEAGLTEAMPVMYVLVEQHFLTGLLWPLAVAGQEEITGDVIQGMEMVEVELPEPIMLAAAVAQAIVSAEVMAEIQEEQADQLTTVVVEAEADLPPAVPGLVLPEVQQLHPEPWVLEEHRITLQAAEPLVAVVEDITAVAVLPVPIAVQVRVAEAHPGPGL